MTDDHTMSNDEQLVQRFLDQELSAEERLALLLRIGREQALRDRVIDLERLTLNVSRLPRPAVPGDFVARVMEQTIDKRSAWRGLIDLLWTPRELTWNLAGAMAAASVALFATAVIVSQRGPRVQVPAPVPGVIAATGSSERVLVRLVVLQPDAQKVAVAGDFNGWDPTRTPLEQTASGGWTVTIPLEPGRYEYQFVVDGQRWVADPFAVEQSDDGFGSRNAVLDVRPPMGETL